MAKWLKFQMVWGYWCLFRVIRSISTIRNLYSVAFSYLLAYNLTDDTSYT